MVTFKKKTLIISAAIIFVLLSLVVLIPATRISALEIIKNPLQIFSLLRREVAGLIFYHYNYLENDKLNKENNLLRYKINSLSEISRENQRLGDLLSVKQQSGFKVIPAKVIGRAPDSWSSLIIIDRGTDSGIARGMPVLSYLGLIGRVMESAGSVSKIMLINDPNLAVSAMVQRSRQEGLICGTLGTNLMMRYLPEDADIKIGDTIISSGLNQTCPKGLLIGSVIEIEKEFSGLSRYAIVRPAARLSNLEEVLVVLQ